MATTINLNIPLSFNQIIELVKQLPKTQQDKIVELLQEDFVVPEMHKNIVRERIKTATDASFQSWDDAKKQLKRKK